MRPSACILLPHTGVYPGLGGMLAEVLSERGWRTLVGHRAEAAHLQTDFLLLAGQCRNLDGLPEVLALRRGKTPVTVVWQLEPLPPAELSPHGEAIGWRVSACDWGRMPRAARRVLNGLVPFRTYLLRLARRWLARSYSRQVVREPDHQGWKRYNVENHFMAAAEWRWIKHAHARGWIDHWFTTVQPRVRFLRSRGLAAELIPVGYHPAWGRDLGLVRDVDVLFLGSIGRGPRGAVLRRLREDLARRGRSLTLTGRCDQAARERWLNRARIVLSLLRVPHDLAGMRVLLGMACGALVVSEHCADAGEFRPGEHLVMAPADRLPELIDYYLAHEEERRTIALQGHRFVTEQLTLASVVDRMLAHVAAGASS